MTVTKYVKFDASMCVGNDSFFSVDVDKFSRSTLDAR